MGLGIEIQHPAPSRESASERSSALEGRLRASNRAATRRVLTSPGGAPSDPPTIYDRQGRTSLLSVDLKLDPGEPSPRKPSDVRETDRPFGVAPNAMTAANLAAAPRLSPTETQLIQAAVTLAAETRAASRSPVTQGASTAEHINAGTGKTPEVGLGSPVVIPRAATPQDLMRVATALRQRLLRSPEPTLRDRELAGLASKVEAQARAMAKAESDQKMALLKEGLERPEISPRVVRPEMEHIIAYLDSLNQSRPEALSYYAEEKMQDLVLDVKAESWDLRMLDSANYDLINSVFIGDPAEESFITEVLTLRDPYPGETVFVG